MKALIIAAGRGSRLNGLTKDKPKSLLRLLGLSLIERIILTAKQAGVDEFVVTIGYLGDKIQANLGDGRKFGVKITYIENKEWEKGNGVSVLKAKGLLSSGNFFLLMSDHIFDVRILKELVDYDTRRSVRRQNFSDTWGDLLRDAFRPQNKLMLNYTW
jgi:CDP-L-myo-inositol myo-inositolphosphotransferase